jgi:hypothetical protein
MIGYDQYWYAKQLELGLIVPQPQKAIKKPETAAKPARVTKPRVVEVRIDNSEDSTGFVDSSGTAMDRIDDNEEEA